MMNFNPMQLMQMKNSGNFPKEMIADMLEKQAGNNPVLKNAVNMFKNGDEKGLESLYKNSAKEQGVNPDEYMSKLMGQFGMK